MDAIGWGIVGAGGIADVVAGDFMFADGAELRGVASRTWDKARALADRHGAPRAYGSYRELLDDDDIDVIYVATPHTHHRDVALAAIERGKAVLVEKAFTATLAGTRAVVEAGRSKGVFCMEAMWTRFQPAVVAARQSVAWGQIGDVLSVQGDLCAYRQFDPTNRLFDPRAGGGALLDLGVYVVSFAQDFLGVAKQVNCVGRLAPNGVENAATMALSYEEGGQASLTAAFDVHGPGRTVIHGTEGWIEVEPRFHHPLTLALHRKGAPPRRIVATPLGRGYAHELVEVSNCVRAGQTESLTMPLGDTVEVMRVLEECLHQLGQHPQEADMSNELA